MSMRTTVGVLLCAAVFLATFLATGQGAVYVNLESLGVVFSGTIGAVLLGSGVGGAMAALRACRSALRAERTAPGAVIAALLRVAFRLRKSEEIRIEPAIRQLYPPLGEALELVEDHYRGPEIRDILAAEMHRVAAEGEAHERVFRNMAAYAPGFGVAGSVIGMIALLLGLGETSVILKSIPMALVSTFYGVVLANFLFVPLAEKMHAATEAELTLRAVVLEGAVALTKRPNARRLLRRLNSLVAVPDRLDETAASLEIQKGALQTTAPAESGGLAGLLSSEAA